jgi:hypothetical protein
LRNLIKAKITKREKCEKVVNERVAARVWIELENSSEKIVHAMKYEVVIKNIYGEYLFSFKQGYLYDDQPFKVINGGEFYMDELGPGSSCSVGYPLFLDEHSKVPLCNLNAWDAIIFIEKVAFEDGSVLYY